AIAVVLSLWLSSTLATSAERVDWLGDPLPPGATHRLGTQRMRYNSSVRDMAYSYDGARALVLHGSMLDIWDLGRGELLASQRPAEDSGELWLIAAGRRGPVALLADRAGVVYEWDYEAERLLHRFETGREYLTSLHYSPDEQRVLTLDRVTSILEEWDPATGERLHEIQPGDAKFIRAIYGPEGRTVLVGSSDHMGNCPNVFHYDLVTGELLAGLLPGGWVGVYDLDLSRDGERVLVRLRYGKVTGCRLSEHAIVNRGFRVRGRPGPSARYAGNDDWLLTGSRDGTVRVWDRHTGEVVRRWAPHRGWVRMIRVSPDGEWALSYGDGRFIAETEIATGRCAHGALRTGRAGRPSKCPARA
ncbi:MAG: hypothetical protein J7M38_06065, partial [Armatimonadetes bacterium]|nr:hypothetical protein [Armatimonadota bacterium]